MIGSNPSVMKSKGLLTFTRTGGSSCPRTETLTSQSATGLTRSSTSSPVDCKPTVNNTPKPLAQTAAISHGLFQDYAFLEFQKPALTFEIIGDDFVVDVTTIPTRGLEVYKGINQFAKEVTVFNDGDVAPTKPSCGD
ncbi:hypothetical protein AaE_016189 [Aphanomyces astaci]|uniref:Uncharacterized protein n=1 Tax=Aphanomyces astaci TaxID=112090 RepID=A0A6A4YXJ0_APHAT|nr:hypothetical protein AaE_016189 [Aphanomyces astaci]